MAISNITQLPSSILIDIFQFVESKDLFQLTTVCKLFNDVISNSPTLLLEMPLNLNKFNLRQEFIGTRKYSNIIISGEKLKARLPFIKSIAGSIVKFQLCHELDYGRRYKEYWRSFKINDFIELLRMLPKLRHLRIFPPYYLKKKALKDQWMLTLKLDSLSGNLVHMFPLFYNCRVKEFNPNPYYYDDSLDFIEFLKKQKFLQKLFIISNNNEIFNDNSLAKVDFKLKKLKWDYNISDSYNNLEKIENMVQFLQQFHDSLELLELAGHNHQVLRVLPEFKKLKDLRIDDYGYFLNYPGLILPNVERLRLLFSSVRTFTVTASMFPNLKHLTFPNFTPTALQQFTKLESITAINPYGVVGPTSAKKLTIIHTLYKGNKPFDFNNHSFEEIHIQIRPEVYPQWLKEFIDSGYAAKLKVFKVKPYYFSNSF